MAEASKISGFGSGSLLAGEGRAYVANSAEEAKSGVVGAGGEAGVGGDLGLEELVGDSGVGKSNNGVSGLDKISSNPEGGGQW